MASGVVGAWIGLALYSLALLAISAGMVLVSSMITIMAISRREEE